MKKSFIFAAFAFAAAVGARAATQAEIEAQKKLALQSPFANDLGPETIDVSKYPANIQAGYKLLEDRCAQCHTPRRPLNSQFAETEGKDLAERKAAVAHLRKENPKLFADKSVLQIEGDIWQRYVKRMMSKPGCGADAGGKMTKDDAKKIWQFLVYDSNERKIKHPEAWEAHRKKLLAEFKEKYPKRYEELYGPGGSEAGPVGKGE